MVVLEMHRYPPIPPTVFRSDLAIPAELESIIMRALRKSTTQRYQSMREIFNDFDALGSTLDMTTLETVGRRVDNEGHRAAELHEREEPEWLDEELLLVEPKPAKPIIRSPQLLSEVDTTMPMAIDPETSKQSTTVPMNRPRVSDELPTSSPLGPIRRGEGDRLSAPVATVLPKASHQAGGCEYQISLGRAVRISNLCLGYHQSLPSSVHTRGREGSVDTVLHYRRNGSAWFLVTFGRMWS